MLLALGISAVAGYLLGSVNFAVLVAKKHGVDILKEGSGNPGATNVKRVLGKGPGNLVFALDALKGFVGAGLLGHCFSCFLGFKGGKGVASTIGGLLVLLPVPIVIGAALWALAFFATRYVSVASLALGLSLPLSCWLLPKFTSLQFGPAQLIFAGAIALFNVWTHRSNIGRLLRGEENKFTKKTS
jgi:glycerol-3-phosphate acyltransferase PlsY